MEDMRPEVRDVTSTSFQVNYQDNIHCVLQILSQWTNVNQNQNFLFLNGTYLTGNNQATLATYGVSASNSVLQLVDQQGAYVSLSKITIPPKQVITFTATTTQNQPLVAIPYDGFGQSAPCAVVLNQQPVTPVENANGTFTSSYSMLGTTLGGECTVLVGVGQSNNGLLSLRDATQAAQISLIVQL